MASFYIRATVRGRGSTASMSDAALEASEVLHTLMPIERIEMPSVSQAIEERQIDVESSDDVKIEVSQEVRPQWQTADAGNRKKKNKNLIKKKL